MRLAAAVAAALVVLCPMVLTARLAGRIPATSAGLLLATSAASPLIESFTLSGELLASLPAVALAARVHGLSAQRRRPMAGRGRAADGLCGDDEAVRDSTAAWPRSPSSCDTRRRSGLAPSAVIVLTALVPVGVAVLSAPSLRLVVCDRHLPWPGRLDRVGIARRRLSQFWDTLPEVAGRCPLWPRWRPSAGGDHRCWRGCGWGRRRLVFSAVATSTPITTSSWRRRWRCWPEWAPRDCSSGAPVWPRASAPDWPCGGW